MSGKKREFSIEGTALKFTCSCGGTFVIDSKAEPPLLLHSMPPCEAFVKMEFIDFITMQRKLKEN